MILQVQTRPIQRSAKLSNLFVLSPLLASASATVTEFPSDAPTVTIEPRKDFDWLKRYGIGGEAL